MNTPLVYFSKSCLSISGKMAFRFSLTATRSCLENRYCRVETVLANPYRAGPGKDRAKASPIRYKR